jgi:hypothetical protein
MMPLRLAAQAAVLDAEPGVVLVSSAFEVMTFLLNFTNAVSGHGQVMFRRSEVVAAGGYAAEIRYGEDYDLWIRLLRRGRIRTLPLIGMRQRQHDDRLSVQYANKRPNKGRIQREALSHYLERPVREDEITAVLAVWRADGSVGIAAAADAMLREAYARFRGRTSDRGQRRLLRARISRQWIAGARPFEKAGHFTEAARYLARAARWSPSLDVALSAMRLAGSLSASLGRKVLRGHAQDK